MRAVGYFRETKSDNLEKQNSQFLDFCRANGYVAAATFFESGDDAEGHQFRQLLDFVQRQAPHGFLVVVVPAFATMGASVTEAARRFFQLSSVGVPIISIAEEGEIAPRLIETWAAHRAGDGASQRVKAAMRDRAIKGQALGRPPFGYKVGANRRLAIVPEEGSVVRYIYRLYLKDGLGIRRIARRLNQEELPTRRGGLWSMVTVRDILRNRVYVGTYSRFGVRVPASHMPLIGEEDFRRVQERLDEKRPAAAKRHQSPFMLSGLLFCGYCGNKMIGVTRRQKWQRGDGSVRRAQYRYYQCESRTNRSLCDYHTWKAEVLEAKVREVLSQGKPGALQAEHTNGAHLEGESSIRTLLAKVRRLDRKLEQYLDSAAAGQVSDDRLRVLTSALVLEQLGLEEKLVESQRLARIEASEHERIQERERVLLKLKADWDELSFYDRQELVRRTFDRIVVRDDSVEAAFRQ